MAWKHCRGEAHREQHLQACLCSRQVGILWKQCQGSAFFLIFLPKWIQNISSQTLTLKVIVAIAAFSCMPRSTGDTPDPVTGAPPGAHFSLWTYHEFQLCASPSFFLSTETRASVLKLSRKPARKPSAENTHGDSPELWGNTEAWLALGTPSRWKMRAYLCLSSKETISYLIKNELHWRSLKKFEKGVFFVFHLLAMEDKARQRFQNWGRSRIELLELYLYLGCI